MNTGRGEKWVIAQVVLLAAIALAPLLGRSPSSLSILFGLILLTTGSITVLLSIRTFRQSLTVKRRSLETSQLVQTGLYSLVRHPMYSSLILIAAGWSVIWMSMIGLFLTAALALVLDGKASWEEKRLIGRFPEYAAYRQRVHKLIPWFY